METLFKESDIPQKERPTKLTEKQRDLFYNSKAQEIINEGWANDEIETIAEDLADLPLSENGYELGKIMEDKGYYGIELPFCEWLEDIERCYRGAIERNVRAWVNAHNIKPRYEQGQSLKVIKYFARGFEIDDEIFITDIYNDTAKYVLHHDKDYNGGILIPFEKIEECCKILES